MKKFFLMLMALMLAMTALTAFAEDEAVIPSPEAEEIVLLEGFVAEILDESEIDSDKISIGCVVTVTNLDNGKTMPAMKIVGSQEANAMRGAMSEDSPFGKAVMGKKAGDEVRVDAPSGVIPYRIEKIER